MPRTIFTTASGVHARPLAEFCALGMLMFAKRLWRMLEDQEARRWERYAGTDLEDRTLGIIGLGRVGAEVARLGKALGMRVIGTNVGKTEALVDEVYRPQELHKVLRQAEFLVLCVPQTPATDRMISAAELLLLPAGAVLINVSRGSVVDEQALTQALSSGHLAGAVLDVFDVEPLPAESPLWRMPNVLVSPHSASTSDRENRRIVDLFCDNLGRYLAGQPLRNVLDTEKRY